MNVYILDTSSFMYRAYHASKDRPYNTKDGVPCQAVLYFRTMIERLMKQQPDYIVAACDTGKPSFRCKLYPKYKANRLVPPEDYLVQKPGMYRVLDDFNIPRYECDDYEADDVIGTLARKADNPVVIVSGDKDMAQLVDGRTRLLRGDNLLDAVGVEREFGVTPGQITDYLALVGDVGDNVPGAPGIGPAGAVEILQQFGNVETALKRWPELRSARHRKVLRHYPETILLCKRLVTIDCNVPLVGVIL